MAIYHCSIKTFSRSAAKSAVAAAAYRACALLRDERLGLSHDYTRKGGHVSTDLIFPAGATAIGIEEIWNMAEAAEARKNSTVAREFEVALPAELELEQRFQLACDFANWLVAKYGFVAQVSLHAPSKKGLHQDTDKNWHGHILTSTRNFTDGKFDKKCRALDDRNSGEVAVVREQWAVMCNQALEKAGHESRVDHRSLVDQGITDREPGRHIPIAGIAALKKGEQSTFVERLKEEALAQAAIDAAKKSAVQEVAFLDAQIAAAKQQLGVYELAEIFAQRDADEAAIAVKKKADAQTFVRVRSAVVEEVVAVKERVLRSEQELEALKKARIAEAQKIHATVVELNQKRLLARTADEIAIAKTDLIKFSNELTSNADAIIALDSKLLQLNSRFGGLAERLPEFMVPGRSDLMKKLAAKRELAIKIKSRIKKTELIAKADEVRAIDQTLYEAKKRQAQIIAEVADIDADLTIVNRESKPRQPQHSRLVRHRDKENEFTL